MLPIAVVISLSELVGKYWQADRASPVHSKVVTQGSNYSAQMSSAIGSSNSQPKQAAEVRK